MAAAISTMTVRAAWSPRRSLGQDIEADLLGESRSEG